MSDAIATYAGLKLGVLDWLGQPANRILASRFDDFLQNCERRMYYGYATGKPDHPLHAAPLRILEMESAITQTMASTTALPVGFLELISAQIDGFFAPLQIVSERVLDSYVGRNFDRARLIAVSGADFRIVGNPSGGACTLRYFRKLTTPTPAGATNDILTNYPDIYLHGCLIEAAIFLNDQAAATGYASAYNASVDGLNARTAAVSGSRPTVAATPEGPAP